MGRQQGQGRPPSERPSKICPVCGRSFLWRRLWADCWDSVIYCSNRCRTNRNRKQD